MNPHVSAIRTQIYLPHELHQEVVKRARNNRTSLAAVIRQAIVDTITHTKPVQTPTYDLIKHSGALHDKTANDVATNLDKYLKQMYQEKYP